VDFKKILLNFIVVFFVTLAVSVIVTFLWNRIIHGACATDWETSFRLAIIFGIVLTWIKAREKKESQ